MNREVISPKILVGAAETKTLPMRGNSLHGNRETLEIPSPQGEARSEKALCRTSDMYVSRESDGPIVPEKRANKAGANAAAESVEGRGSTKGNAERTCYRRDSIRRGFLPWRFGADPARWRCRSGRRIPRAFGEPRRTAVRLRGFSAWQRSD